MSYKTEPINQSFTYKYKNAEIELVVEDNAITTAKIYMDGECEEIVDITNPNGGEFMFTPKNRKAVCEDCAKTIDRLLAEDGREECTDMALVRR